MPYDVNIKNFPRLNCPVLAFNQQKIMYQRLADINRIVIHHTANKAGNDTAASIHAQHLRQGYAGIGYHFLIRQNGMIEKGRPQSYIGAHAEGYNSRSLGIALSGNFEAAIPQTAQISALIDLLAMLEYYYPIQVIQSHCDLNATACPGKNLVKLLPGIKKAAAEKAQRLKS